MLASLGSVGRVGRMGLSGRAALVGRPSLALDFMQPGTLDSRITFTRASTATYTDASGTIQTAVVNQPRWDYDPVTNALKGLLIEEARTNFVWPSIPSGTWATSAVTFIPASGTAPDGTNTFTKMVSDTTNSFHGIQGGITSVANATYTFSVYAKMAGIRYLQVMLDDVAPSFATWSTFDLQTGTIYPGQNNPSSFMIPLGNGVYRCGITAQCLSQPTLRCSFNNCNTNNPGFFGPAYVGDGVSGTLLWGAQLEQGAFATSYIPTTVAAVTRAADQALLTVSGWYTPPGGSWFAEIIPQYFPAAGRIVQNTLADNRGPLFFDGSGKLGQFDGNFFFTANNATVNTVVRGVSTWAPGAAKVCLNGGAVATSAVLATGYPVIGPVVLMVTNTLSETTTGYMRRLQYWPRVLSNAEMQAVTA